jgi:hypothetical protein
MTTPSATAGKDISPTSDPESESGEAKKNKNEFEITLEDGTKLVIKLTFFDRIMRKLLSKEEFEARLLEKIEKAKEAHRRATPHQQPK